VPVRLDSRRRQARHRKSIIAALCYLAGTRWVGLLRRSKLA